MDFDVKKVIENKIDESLRNYPKLLRNIAVFSMSKILHLDFVSDFLKENENLRNFDLIDELFQSLDFSYYVSARDRYKIPSEGRLVVVSNHPLGGLDGLALLRAISEVRQDVRIVANDVLMNLNNLSDLFLPWDVFSSKKIQKQQILNIEQALKNDEVVIFFPSGEVSRLTARGIIDKHWQKGAVRFANKSNSAILPVKIKGRNTALFYLISMIYKRASTFLLPHEMLQSVHKNIFIKIGNPLPISIFPENLNLNDQTEILRKHTFNIGKKKKMYFKADESIIHPVSRKTLKKELKNSLMILEISNDKKIYLCKHESAENVIREISRLRELTFRKVGEGTGKNRDFDKFDKYYHHLVLWDDSDLEIIGSYRLGICSEIMEHYGRNGLYNSDQFIISSKFDEQLRLSIELGRSFIQEKYWRSNALDYIWKGIGKILNDIFPNVRYLFGAVSISDAYPDKLKNMIVYFYDKWYGKELGLVFAKDKFEISESDRQELSCKFDSTEMMVDFRKLKSQLTAHGTSVPVLLRNYTNLVEKEGCRIHGFGVDKGFANSVDVLLQLDLSYLRPSIRQRYYPRTVFEEEKEYA